MWISCKDHLPKMRKNNEWSQLTSVPVLAVVFGSIRIVTLEQWDEGLPPEWYSNCSESWNLGYHAVDYWQPLPALPEDN